MEEEEMEYDGDFDYALEAAEEIKTQRDILANHERAVRVVRERRRLADLSFIQPTLLPELRSEVPEPLVS